MSLSVRVTKPGYYTRYSQTPLHFAYADTSDRAFHQPNPANPVRHFLQKKGQAEPLIAARATIPLPRTGVPVRYDLLNKKMSEEGQLRVQAWKLSEKDPATGHYDWRFAISIENGGLLPHEEELPHLAPAAGYESRFEFDYKKEDAINWQGDLNKSFYIKFGNPQKFGRLAVRISGIGLNCYVDLWVNPSGSRNLEYDSQAQPKSRVYE